ncbi:MAG: oligosaccharide flippase family protein, partial [Erysipelotrichales bacterium]|nr:oligosaccharide flippase family protein [Erysipelotrichales bacterium]
MSKNNLFKSAFIYSLGFLFIKGIGIITSPIYTRLLSTEQYGAVSVFYSWSSLFTLIIGLYTYGSIINAKSDFEESEYKNYITSILALSSLSFFIFLIIIIWNTSYVSKILGFSNDLLLLLIVHSFINYIFNFMSTKLIYEGKRSKYLLVSFIQAISSAVLSIFLMSLMNENRIIGRVIGDIIPLSIFAAGFVILCLYQSRMLYCKKYWKYALNLSIPLIFSSLSNLLLAQSDRIMMQHLLTEKSVGIYSFNYMIGDTFSFLRFGFINTWIPFYMNKHIQLDTIRKSSKVILHCMTILTIGYFLTIPEVVKLLSTSAYWSGIVIISFVVIGQYFLFVADLMSVSFQKMKKNKIIAVVSIIAAVVNITLNLIFMKKFGIIVGALTTLVSFIVMVVIYYCYMKAIKYEIPIKINDLIVDVSMIIFFQFINLIFLDNFLIRYSLG